MITRRFLKLFILSILIFSQAQVFAKNNCRAIFQDGSDDKPKLVRLVRKGNPVKNYQDLLENLKTGDRIDLGEGHIFTFYNYLSDERSGDMTTIIDVGNGWALRLSRHFSHTFVMTPELMKKEMMDWCELIDELRENGVPVVDVNKKESKPPFFILVKKENFIFRLSDLFVNGRLNLKSPTLAKIDPQVVRQALEKLIVFAGKTWMYRSIGDYRYEQLGYNGVDWLLFDVGKRWHAPLANFDDQIHSFSHPSEDPYSNSKNGNFLPRQYLRHIDELIRNERLKASREGQWISRKTYTGKFGFDNSLIQGLIKEPIPAGRKFKISSGNPEVKRGIPTDPEYDKWSKREVSFKVKSLIKSSDLFSFYEVKIRKGPPAILKVLRRNDDAAVSRLQQDVAEIKEKRKSALVAYGSDFIVFVGEENLE